MKLLLPYQNIDRLKKQLIHILQGTASIMAILMLMLVFQSNHFFKHVHYLSDGTTVEHAHPFSDDNGDQHKHNKNEIAFLSLLTPDTDLVQDFPSLNIQSSEIFLESSVLADDSIRLMELPLHAKRGPPNC